jgi:hypothetical protein
MIVYYKPVSSNGTEINDTIMNTLMNVDDQNMIHKKPYILHNII